MLVNVAIPNSQIEQSPNGSTTTDGAGVLTRDTGVKAGSSAVMGRASKVTGGTGRSSEEAKRNRGAARTGTPEGCTVQRSRTTGGRTCNGDRKQWPRNQGTG